MEVSSVSSRTMVRSPSSLMQRLREHVMSSTDSPAKRAKFNTPMAIIRIQLENKFRTVLASVECSSVRYLMHMQNNLETYNKQEGAYLSIRFRASENMLRVESLADSKTSEVFVELLLSIAQEGHMELKVPVQILSSVETIKLCQEYGHTFEKAVTNEERIFKFPAFLIQKNKDPLNLTITWNVMFRRYLTLHSTELESQHWSSVTGDDAVTGATRHAVQRIMTVVF